MRPSDLSGGSTVAGQAPASQGTRRAPVAAAGVALLVLAAYAETLGSMVSTWLRNPTFAHGFVVFPVFVWLLWRAAPQLRTLPARSYWPGLVLVASAGLLWLLSDVVTAAVGKQLALVLLIQAAILTLLGPRLFAAMLFPLAFLFFAVPMGEFLLPTLMDWTANVTVASLRASGIPVYRQGNDFVIPSGSWSVVEACSGLRYLIASIMGGSLFAYLTYRTAWRRWAFVGVSIVVPLVANWLRAYLIVMIGHLSDNKLAVGIDHLIYGWLFFGVVVFALFGIGALWREPEAADDRVPTGAARADPAATPMSFGAPIAVVLVAVLWIPMGAALEGEEDARPVTLSPIAAPAGWTAAAEPIAEWKPRYAGHRGELEQTFARSADRVGVYVAYYRGQREGAELIGANNAIATTDDPAWRLTAAGRVPLQWQGSALAANGARLAGQRFGLEVAYWFWVDGRVTASEHMAKLYLAWSKLRSRRDDAALVVLYAARPDDADMRPLLQALSRDLSPAIASVLAKVRDPAIIH